MVYLLAFAVSLALILAGVSLYRYGNIPRQHPIVTLSVLTAWCFSFMIVFTIPLDVTSTVYRQCLQEHNATLLAAEQAFNTTNHTDITDIPNCQKPWGMVPDSVFPSLLRINYWTSQFLTWLIMPLIQSYLKAGDFHFKGKLKSALIDNAIYYGTYLFICGILLIYIALKPGVHLDWQKLKAIASSASNTWGLFLLVLLLGYALVEMPRSLWNNSKPGFTLQYAYFKAAKLSAEKAEAEENVDDVLESLQTIAAIVPLNDDELRPCVETILRKVPPELLERAHSRSANNGRDRERLPPSEKSLVRLHRQVIKSLQTLQRTEALWSVQVEKALHLEDIQRNHSTADRRFKSEFPRSKARLHPVVEWYWYCRWRPPVLKGLAAITALYSLMVVWSELTFFNRSPVLSIFANIINGAKASYDFGTIEFVSMITLCYLCYCAYSTVFRIRLLDLYYLAPHHQTNEHSLIFSGMLLCRLTPPMCLNFLGLIHMDSHIIRQRVLETHYTQIMGHMDVLEIVSDGFNIYFPMVMLAICAATWFSCGSRTLNALGFSQFIATGEDGEMDGDAAELVNDGRELIARERRKLRRAAESVARRTRPVARPGDNLLTSGGVMQPASTAADVGGLDFARSLSEEINERFGASTQRDQVAFRGHDYSDMFDNDDEEIDELGNIRERQFGTAPRRIFDDV